MSQLIAHVEQSLQRRRLLPRGARVLVAVSGGLDSMVLLHVLHALARQNRWRLAVAHFNHQLRGAASRADEAFVKRAAQRLRCRFVSARGDVRSLAVAQKISLEMAARVLRHDFLAACARRLKCGTIALAHHADDQVELFYLRLLRGSGGEGLAGMKWKSASPSDAAFTLVRPLLDQSKAALREFAAQEKIHFREDASNRSLDILRNRVRHELLPLLRRRYQPALEPVTLRVMSLIGEEAALITRMAQAWLTECSEPAFGDLPVALQRRVLQLQLVEQELPFDYELVERLRATADQLFSVDASTRVSRGADGRVSREMVERAEFRCTALVVELSSRKKQLEFAGRRIRWAIVAAAQTAKILPRHVPGQECFDADAVGEEIVLRHWQPGDRFKPIGLAHAVKLHDWFINQKVPRARRHELLVATTAAGEIFWVEGERIGERFKLTRSTKRCLRWRWA